MQQLGGIGNGRAYLVVDVYYDVVTCAGHGVGLMGYPLRWRVSECDKNLKCSRCDSERLLDVRVITIC